MALTPKEQLFVAEYLIDLNAAAAGRRVGYSAKTAKEIGYQMLGKAHVQEAVTAAMAARTERTEVNADWLLKRLADEAEADVADLFDDAGHLLPVKQWPEIWRKGLVAGVEIEQLFEGRGGDRRQIGVLHKVKLSDRVKRLELIGKHVDVQAFKDKVDHDVSDKLHDLIMKSMEPRGP